MYVCVTFLIKTRIISITKQINDMAEKLSPEERQRRDAEAQAKREATATRIKANRIKRELRDAEVKERRDAGTLKPTTLKDLCFPVELNDNPRATNQEYSKVVTGIIDGEEVDLNYCSPIYELVPNEMIFPKVEEILEDNGIDFSVEYSHTHNARFYGNYTILDPRFRYKMEGTNDWINFVWNFQHSYNGLTKYKGVAGFFRTICENGLVVPVEEMKEYNLCLEGKHTSSILRSLEQFASILVNVTQNMDTVKTSITDKYEKLGGVWVAKHQDRVTEVLNANKISIIENSKFNTLNDISARIMSEAIDPDLGYDGKVNDWLIYNGINQYLNDDSRNIVSPEKRRDVDSKVLEYMLETV